MDPLPALKACPVCSQAFLEVEADQEEAQSQFDTLFCKERKTNIFWIKIVLKI